LEFTDLIFDNKKDYVGGGGYGDVFKANYLHTPVAIKKFGRRYQSKKALKDFIKEVEFLH
jgi:hypothetical protein